MHIPWRAAASCIAAALLLALPACDTVEHAADAVATATAPEPRDSLELFASERPSWPSELDAVSLGQTPQQWREALPRFDADGVLTSERFADTEYRWHLDERSGRIDGLLVHFASQRSPLDALAQSWGQPLAAPDEDGRARHVWFVPDDGLRAQLRPGAAEGRWILEIGRYLPLAELIGTEPGPLAFEAKTPLLGASPQTLAAAWPQAWRVPEGEEASAGTLELPPAELDAYWTTVDPEFGASGKLERYTLAIRTTAERLGTVLETLRTKYGEPLRGGLPETGEVMVFLSPEHALRVRATRGDAPPEVRLVVERYLPLAELLAPLRESRRFAFERDAPWIGQLTRERFRAELASGGSGATYDEGWLSLPPIEYDDEPLPVFPEFGPDGVVVGYRVNLGYGLVAEGRDAILAALEAALGAPRELEPGKTPQRFVFEGTPAIVLEDSAEAREWMVRVGALPSRP